MFAVRRPRAARAFAASFAVLVLAGPAAAGGFRGVVYERTASGGIGAPIPGVAVAFQSEDRAQVWETTSAADGGYQLELPAGRYYATATSPAFADYSSSPGLFVVVGGSVQTGNFFLRRPQVTVALVVRHADRAGSADALTPAGEQRARELARVARDAGVTAVFSTNTARTLATAAPLAELLKLQTRQYATPAELARAVAAEHAGDVVLVVGHSDTIAGIAEALLGRELYPGNPIAQDFDNMLVVARRADGDGAGSVVHLQYGADSTPDAAGLSAARTTNILLLRHAEPSGAGLSAAGQARAAELARVARKAGAAALFAPQASASSATLAPLAATLGLPTTSYDPANVPALAGRIFQGPPGRTVVVAGTRATLQGLLAALGAEPFPALFADEFDRLFVAVAPAQGRAHLLNLQYAAPSP